MPENKVIAVVGATGAQGGSLVEAILEHPESGLTVRALTFLAVEAVPVPAHRVKELTDGAVRGPTGGTSS